MPTFPADQSFAGADSVSNFDHASLHSLTPYVYNIKGFGAVGNGTTADDVAIQAAIDAAFAAGGGTVYVPATSADYLIADRIVLKTGVRFAGAGKASLIRKNATSANESIVFAENVTDVEICNVAFRNTGMTSADTQYIIYIRGVNTKRVRIHHCTFFNSWIGVVIHGPDFAGSLSSKQVAVTDNFLYDIGHIPIGINHTGTGDCIVDRNIIDHWGMNSGLLLGAAIEYRGSLRGSITNNRITDGDYSNVNDGIRVEYNADAPVSEASRIVVAHNVIRDVSRNGITNQWNSDNVIIGNVVEDATESGIALYSDQAAGVGSCRNVVASNRVVNCGSYGIQVNGNGTEYAELNVLEGNVITGGAEGILFSNSNRDNLVADNLITGTTGPGIRHTAGDRNTYRGNKIIDCGSSGTYGFIITAGTGNRLYFGEAYDTRTPKLQTYGLRNAGTDTLVYGGVFGPNLTGEIDDAGTNTHPVGTLGDLSSASFGLQVNSTSRIKKFLDATTVWDPASVADGAMISTTITVTGAVIGNAVIVSFSNAVPAGAILSGQVTGADTVTVTLFNKTGGALDLASGTLRADVWVH